MTLAGSMPLEIASAVVIPIGLFLNFGTLVFIIKLRRRVSYFVVNLSMASALAILDQIVGILQYNGIFKFEGDILCGVNSLMRNLPLVVIPISVMGDTYYKYRQPVPDRGRAAVIRIVGLTWIFSIIVLLPTYFNYSYLRVDVEGDLSKFKCVKTDVLNSYTLTSMYYWHRTIFYHFCPAIYLFVSHQRTKKRINDS